MYDIDKSKGKNTCSRCGGPGGSTYPTWMKYSPNGIPGGCYRCGGTGVEPASKKREFIMCNKLKYKQFVSSINKSDRVLVEYLGIKGNARLNSFARIEKNNWWRKHGAAKSVDIMADSFMENGLVFKVPGGKIAGLGLKQDVVVNGKTIGKANSVKILTRAAHSSLEIATHERFPVVIVDNGNGPEIYYFNSSDVISADKPIQKELL
jgi:hypothetical protein